MKFALRAMICGCVPAILMACTPASPAVQDLQRRCDREASAWFQAQHPGGAVRESVDSAIHTEQYGFSDHYNPRLRRCFVISSEEKSTVYPDKAAAGTSGKSLQDLAAGAPLGRVVNPWPAAPGALQICSVEAKRCTSTREWEELAAPYMER